MEVLAAGSDHLLPEPGPDLAPAPWSAWAEQSLPELLSHFWQDPFSRVAAEEPLARQAPQPGVAAGTSLLTREFAGAFLVHSGTDEKGCKQ